MAYIDREKVVEHLQDVLQGCGNPDVNIYPVTWGTVLGYEAVLKYIQKLPEADVVEVVRCRDCEYRTTIACPMYSEEFIHWDDDGYIECDVIIRDNTTDNGFCDCGQKKEVQNV